MPKISVCICFRNDFELIYDTVSNLCEGLDITDLEVIIYNDGSVADSGEFQPLEAKDFEFKNVRVINNPSQRGIGAGFDVMAKEALSDTIVLCGSDIRTRDKEWLHDVLRASEVYPDTIGCCACVGLTPTELNLDHEGRNIYYGATIELQSDVNSLSKDSPKRINPDYTALFEASWLHEKQSEEPYEIPCALGAFYFVSKAYYEKIGGWDTDPNDQYIGHRQYGNLEPYISIKSWLYGGGVTMFPNIEVGHIFSRIGQDNFFTKRAIRHAEHWWNRFFIAETMVLDAELRYKIINFIKPCLASNTARRDINHHFSSIMEIKSRNMLGFLNSFADICRKFNIKIK
jgi:glycosyltransferase involved in cell wall biosynthesis